MDAAAARAGARAGTRDIDPHHHVWDDQRGRYLTHELAAESAAATTSSPRSSSKRARCTVPTDRSIEAGRRSRVRQRHRRDERERPLWQDAPCAGIVGHADLMLGDKATPVLEALAAAGNGRFRASARPIWASATPRSSAAARCRGTRCAIRVPQRIRAPAAGPPLVRSLALPPAALRLADLLRAYPESNVVMNHCGGLLGIPPTRATAKRSSRSGARHRKLAQFPGLTVKIGGLGMLYCNWDFHLREPPPTSEELAAAWRPYVETCIEAFGADRCLMESNFPATSSRAATACCGTPSSASRRAARRRRRRPCIAALPRAFTGSRSRVTCNPGPPCSRRLHSRRKRPQRRRCTGKTRARRGAGDGRRRARRGRAAADAKARRESERAIHRRQPRRRGGLDRRGKRRTRRSGRLHADVRVFERARHQSHAGARKQLTTSCAISRR